MGSKGSQTVTNQGNQTQTYTPNPAIGGAGNQALGMATTAAGAPFQQPVAPVAPFTPFQSIGFGETLGLQGMAQPYFNTAGNYLAGSAAPVSAADVANYYNPMAANVTAQMQNIFGQQNVQNTGNLVQSAGGVGADRVAVGQANMANQQALAAGQTYAGLYQQALAAAEQNKQMQAGAGFAFGQMGPAAQAAQQNAVNQLLGVGAQQQGLTQQELNAIYQNQLAQIAYPFQTGQYLAGITGGLAPAMGGTTQGQYYGQTTYPAPSGLAQALGLGAAGLGLMGQMGGIPGMSAMGLSAAGQMPFGSAMQYLPGQSAYGATPSYQNGGYYPMFGSGPGYDDGGAVDPGYGELSNREKYQEYAKIIPAAAQGNPAAETFLKDVGFDDGGWVQGLPSNLQTEASKLQSMLSNPNLQGLPPGLVQAIQRMRQQQGSMPSNPFSQFPGFGNSQSAPMAPASTSMQTPSMSQIPALPQPQAIMPNVQLPSGPMQSSPFMPASQMQGTLSPRPLGLPNFDDGGSVDIPVGQASPMSLTIDPTNAGLPYPGSGKVHGSPVPQTQLPQGQPGRSGPYGQFIYGLGSHSPSMPQGGGQGPMGGGLGGSLGQLGQLGGSLGKLLPGLGGAGAGAGAGMDFSAATDLGLGDIGAAAAEYAPELALALANRGGRMDTGGAATDMNKPPNPLYPPGEPRGDLSKDPDWIDWKRQQEHDKTQPPEPPKPDEDVNGIPMSARGGAADDAPEHPPGASIGDVARRWQGLNSRFPKSYIDENKAMPRDLAPGVYGDTGWLAAGGAVDPMHPGEGFGDDDADTPPMDPRAHDAGALSQAWDYIKNTAAPAVGDFLRPYVAGDRIHGTPAMASPADALPPKDTAQVPMGDVPLPAPKPVQTVAIKPQPMGPDTQSDGMVHPGPRSYPAHPMDPNDPNYDPKLDPHNAAYDPNDPRLVYADPQGHGDPMAPGVGGGGTRQPINYPLAAGPMGSAPMQRQVPFPQAADPNSIARRWTMSPWAALTNAGVAMATSRGPIGSVLATGIGAAGKTFAGQQQELNSEQAINDKAEQLAILAQAHLDQYTKMTPYQQGELADRRERTRLTQERLSLYTAGEHKQAYDQFPGDDPEQHAERMRMLYPGREGGRAQNADPAGPNPVRPPGVPANYQRVFRDGKWGWGEPTA